MVETHEHGARAVSILRDMPYRGNRFLAELPPADMALLAPHLKDVTLNARDILHETQDAIAHAYFPHSGMVSLLAVTDDGETIETAAIGHEGVVGAAAGLGIRRAFVRAIVQVPGSAARIATSPLQKAAHDSVRIRDMIVRSHEALLVQAQQSAVCSAVHSVEARLARWLLQTQDRTGSDTIPIIQEFLAQLLGVRRTTINLVVGKLHQGGLIRYRRGQVEIVDRAGLMHESCSCYHAIQRQLDGDAPPDRI